MFADSGVTPYVPGFWSVKGVRLTSLTLMIAVNVLLGIELRYFGGLNSQWERARK